MLIEVSYYIVNPFQANSQFNILIGKYLESQNLLLVKKTIIFISNHNRLNYIN